MVWSYSLVSVVVLLGLLSGQAFLCHEVLDDLFVFLIFEQIQARRRRIGIVLGQVRKWSEANHHSGH